MRVEEGDQDRVGVDLAGIGRLGLMQCRGEGEKGEEMDGEDELGEAIDVEIHGLGGGGKREESRVFFFSFFLTFRVGFASWRVQELI